MIQIDGVWKVFDATWGEGNGTSVKGKLVSKKEFDPYWFNVDPYEAIFTHLPEHFSAAKVSPAIDLSAYEKLPYTGATYFNLGFDGKKAYQDSRNMPRLRFPKTFACNTYVKIMEAPPYYLLKAGNNYTFKLHAPRAYQAVVKDADGWHYMEKIDGLFQQNYSPSKNGELKVMLKYEGGGSSFWACLEYEVKGNVTP